MKKLFANIPFPIYLLLSAVLSWFGIHVAFYLVHYFSFDGICGPHAPDIQAYGCSLSRYMQNFNTGFTAIGLFVIKLLGTVFLVGLSALFYHGAGAKTERLKA